MPSESTLIDFDSINHHLINKKEVPRGITAIPISKIVGSWGRYKDFNKEFLPHTKEISSKYQGVLNAAKQSIELPPIKVYKVLDKYFVIDGHHRVMTAKNVQKREFIDAEVTEIIFEDFPLESNASYKYKTEAAKSFLITLQEEAFKKKTSLSNRVLKYPIKVTELTSYAKLLDEIEDFRRFYDKGALADKPLVYASLEWYEKRFLPAVELIIKENLLSGFQKRTYSDLYVWINIHKYYLSKESGYDVGFEFSEKDFISKFREDDSFFDVVPSIFRDMLQTIRGRKD